MAKIEPAPDTVVIRRWITSMHSNKRANKILITSERDVVPQK